MEWYMMGSIPSHFLLFPNFSSPPIWSIQDGIHSFNLLITNYPYCTTTTFIYCVMKLQLSTLPVQHSNLHVLSMFFLFLYSFLLPNSPFYQVAGFYVFFLIGFLFFTGRNFQIVFLMHMNGGCVARVRVRDTAFVKKQRYGYVRIKKKKKLK